MKVILFSFIGVAIVTFTLLFWWYEWRPNQITKKCAEIAYYTGGVGSQEKADEIYRNCMARHGIDTSI